MKICVVQTRPTKGHIQRNIEQHKRFIDLAVSQGADAVFFPELSLTGYEPPLAKTLATNQDDTQLDDFQKISDTQHVTIGVGIPTKGEVGICISMVLFQPDQARQVYSKKYLHVDEEAFFISGQNLTGLTINQHPIALAICYELSVVQHAEDAAKSGADIYIASVAKSAQGVDQAIKRLSDIARTYSMTVLLSNCVGQSDGFECAGNTSIWNNKGVLIGQLDNAHEGLLIIDTDTQAIVTH